MSVESTLLTETLLKQDEILSELLSLIEKQREALREGRLSDLQSLMSDLRHISVRCQAIETKRVRAAAELAASLGCEPVVSEIIAAVGEDDSSELAEAAKKLVHTVGKIKSEMTILSYLMEETKTLNEMMIAEWRRLSQSSLGGGSAGTFDTKI